MILLKTIPSFMQPDICFLVEDLRRKGICHPEVLAAFQATPRDSFVNTDNVNQAYTDRALPLECLQTISQPFVIARMLEEAIKAPSFNRVLEIGTGSGYQTALLSYLAREVYSIERIKTLYSRAKKALSQQHLTNIKLSHKDGYHGWPNAAPFDSIIVSAAALEPPCALLEQLNPAGGRLIIPLTFSNKQVIYTFTKNKNTYKKQSIIDVKFVPMCHGLD